MHQIARRRKSSLRYLRSIARNGKWFESLESRSYLSAVSFAAAVAVDAMSGADEHEVITADFNGDHLPDLAVLRNNTIDVLVNQGNGTFLLKQTLTTGRQAGYIQAANLGDGHLDLIVSNVADGTLDIFTGNGNGTFNVIAEIVTFGTAQPSGFSGTLQDSDTFAVTDLNGDAKPDIVVADGVDNELVTLINQGTGTFSTGQMISTPAANSPIAALATGSGVASGVVILDQTAPIVLRFANQSGMLASSPTQLALGAPSQTFDSVGSLVVGDFNGDGIPDIAASIDAISGGVSYVSVLLGSAGGTFQVAQRNAVPANSQSLALGDFNGSGNQGLVLGANNNASIDILTGNGDGTFTDQDLSLTKGVGDGREIAVADFNGDGNEDFVVAPATSEVYLFTNNAAGLIATTTTLTATPNPAAAGDTVTFTATVGSSGGTPTGSVQFFDSATPLATESLAGGVATFVDSSLADGTHDITADYMGATQFAASVSNFVSETVGTGLGNGLSPTITRSTVPATVVSGSAVRGRITLTVTNSTSTTDVGANLIAIYASTDGAVDDSSILLAHVKPQLNLKTGASQTVVIPVNASTLAVGAYTILAQTTDKSSDVLTSAAGPTLTAAAPFVTLSETVTTVALPASVVSGTVSHAFAKVVITNSGNVALNGKATIDLSASTTANIPGTAINSVTRPVNIRAGGGTATVLVPFKALPRLADGSYYFVANVIDPTGATSVASTSAATTISAPVIDLSVAFGNIPRAVFAVGAPLIVTNAGNINDVSKLTAVIGLSTDSAGADIVGTTAGILAPARLTVQAGKTARVHVTGWNRLIRELASNGPYFLTVTLSDTNENSASVVSGGAV